MNLIDENRGNKMDNKKIIIACGVGIVALLVIIIVLLILVSTMKNNRLSLVVDNQKYAVSSYLLKNDNVVYLGIEDLTKITKNGYNYKSGSKDVEDENKCYITNTYESTFFEVGSKEIYKVLEDINEIEYYTLDNPIIKQNGKIYMPIDAVKIAANVRYTNNNNQIVITSIAFLEGIYNKQQSSTFIPDSSIVWETTYSNKKLLKDRLVITHDQSGLLGLGLVSSTTDSKTKVTKVSTQSIIDPKYVDIKYIEKFNQLIVKTENGKGIVQINVDNGNFSVKTKIVPQYEDIKPINENLYLVTQSSAEKVKKYGIVNQNGELVLPIEYDQIGIDISKFTSNKLNNEYIIYDNLIPVKKDNLWGLVNLNGKNVIKLEYTGLGCISSNSSNNVLIIPELDAIVVRKDNNYGIITKNGKVLMQNVLSKVYKEKVNGKEQYSMVYNDKKYNVVDYINNLNKNNNTNGTNKTNTTNKTNVTNTTNKTNNTTNKTNTTNTTNSNKTTNN